MSNIDSLRYVVIGVAASIFPSHRRAQLAEGVNVVAACDNRAEPGKQRAAEIGCAFYEDYRAMLAETKPDIAIIVTPHPSHPSIAIDCLRAGCHVLVEKPMAIDVASADQMIVEADKSGRTLAINFQHRLRPAVEKARQLVVEGAIGTLVRTLSIEPWFRTAHYYRTADWRAKWTSEGGGVLMNQAPHTLDVLCHLAGLPSKVWGWTRTRYHSIQVEDTAQAMFEYPNGAPGYLTVSTVEVGVAPRQRKAREVAEEIRKPRDLRARLVQGPAVVERLQKVELAQVGFEGVGDAVDDGFGQLADGHGPGDSGRRLRRM